MWHSGSDGANRLNAGKSTEHSLKRDGYGAHALCLAALRHKGLRPSKRYIVSKGCRTRLAWSRGLASLVEVFTTCGIGPRILQSEHWLSLIFRP